MCSVYAAVVHCVAWYSLHSLHFTSLHSTPLHSTALHCTHSLTLTHPLTHSPALLTHSPALLTHSLTHSLTCFTHPLTHSLTPSLPPSLTPSLTHSLTPSSVAPNRRQFSHDLDCELFYATPAWCVFTLFFVTSSSCTFSRPHLPKVIRTPQFLTFSSGNRALAVSCTFCRPLSQIEPRNRGNRDPHSATTEATLPEKNTVFRAQKCFPPVTSHARDMTLCDVW